MPRTSFHARIADRAHIPTAADWRNIGPRWAMSLAGIPPGARLFAWDSMALLLRGIVRLGDDCSPLDLERVAEDIRVAYLDTGTLPTDRLEGGFSIILLDAATERVLLYRNLAGSGPVYYRPTGAGLILSGSLAELSATATEPVRADADLLPAYFLHGTVPGRDTLTAGCQRLLPGELLLWERGRLERRQVRTLDALGGEALAGIDAVEALEETLGRVLRDVATLHERPATILTGGVASSYLQAVANATIRTELLPTTYSVGLDHPTAWAATEAAMSASRGLGTEHQLVPVDGAFAGYLLETIAALGTPPSAAALAYLPTLARALAKGGHRAGLSGLGAGALFGAAVAAPVHRAARLRSWLPLTWLRRGLCGGARLLGARSLARACWLADRADRENDPRHPLNGVAPEVVALVRAHFGVTALRDGMARRRDLLHEFGASDSLLERLHALLLADALDTASQSAELFNAAGVDLVCPFLDSRLLALAARLRPEERYPVGRPRGLVAQALRRHVPDDLIRTRGLDTSPPVGEWLAPGGQLCPLVERSAPPRQGSPAFAFRWLCLDLWRRTVLGATPLPAATPALVPEPVRSDAA